MRQTDKQSSSKADGRHLEEEEEEEERKRCFGSNRGGRHRFGRRRGSLGGAAWVGLRDGRTRQDGDGAAHVKRLVTLSVPWGSSVQEMLTFASGNTLDVPFVDPSLIRNEQRSSEGNLWLLPTPKVFGNTTLVVSQRHNRTYSAKNVTQFLNDIGFADGVEPYRARIRPLGEVLPESGVPVTCLVGTGVDTVESLMFGDEGFDAGPVNVVYGDDDGTVNLTSLMGPIKAWSDSPAQVLEVVELPKVSHMGILKDKSAVDQILRILDSINLNATTTTYHQSYK
ncbi:lecithin-cholesterol acyltransferase-like 1 [Triticum aestivum]|nr:lecithin-cholesterol acyltransferase-like 1 [Triticum aestivum]